RRTGHLVGHRLPRRWRSRLRRLVLSEPRPRPVARGLAARAPGHEPTGAVDVWGGVLDALVPRALIPAGASRTPPRRVSSSTHVPPHDLGARPTMRHSASQALGLLATTLLVTGWGCSGTPPVDTSTAEATVHGVISIKGKPVTSGRVVFDPANIK